MKTPFGETPGYLGKARVFTDDLLIYVTRFKNARPCLVALYEKTGHAWGRFTANIDADELADDEVLFKYRHQLDDLAEAGVVRYVATRPFNGYQFHVARLSDEAMAVLEEAT